VEAIHARTYTALSSIKVASDLVTLVLKAKVDAAVTQKAIELQSSIITLQSTIFGIQTENQKLLEENNSLKQQIIDMNNWESEAQKYSLTEVCPGGVVYAINKDEAGTQPDHWLCPNCYQNRRKSFLQKGMNVGEGHMFTCALCKNQLIVRLGRRR
jgi:hypothetical protein